MNVITIFCVIIMPCWRTFRLIFNTVLHGSFARFLTSVAVRTHYLFKFVKKIIIGLEYQKFIL
jgi:hypothetical protein